MDERRTIGIMLTMDRKLTLIPLVFICLRIWSTVRFILYLLHSPAVTNTVLLCLHASIWLSIDNSFTSGAVDFCRISRQKFKPRQSDCRDCLSWHSWYQCIDRKTFCLGNWFSASAHRASETASKERRTRCFSTSWIRTSERDWSPPSPTPLTAATAPVWCATDVPRTHTAHTRTPSPTSKLKSSEHSEKPRFLAH